MKALPLFLLCASPVFADPAKVEDIQAQQSGNAWRFDVTLSHGDTGWDDYADGWRIETATGDILGTRVLAHPHVNEQPFTRSLGGVTLPAGTTEVFIRASESIGGWAETTTPFALTN